MKRFLINCTLFVLFFSIIANIKPLYLFYTEKYKEVVAGNEIYFSIFKSKQKRKAKKVLIGDSVARQMFPNTQYYDTINSLTCNQSIGLVGQFLLLNNYINAGNKIDTVYLMYSPFSFQNNLNQVFTYHYFLKPFYNDEYRPLLSQTVNDQIEKIPYKDFCRFPYILTSNWAPNFVSKDDTTFTFLSPISIEYLNKIKKLSEENNFKLLIIPPPTSFTNKLKVAKMNSNEISENDFTEIFNNYFNQIIYISDTNFKDGIHLKNPNVYTEYYKLNVIKF